LLQVRGCYTSTNSSRLQKQSRAFFLIIDSLIIDYLLISFLQWQLTAGFDADGKKCLGFVAGAWSEGANGTTAVRKAGYDDHIVHLLINYFLTQANRYLHPNYRRGL